MASQALIQFSSKPQGGEIPGLKEMISSNQLRHPASMLRIEPLNPAEVQDMTGLNAIDAIDAWLITGGFPQIAASWVKGESRISFLARSLSDPLSPLLVRAELTLLGEFSQSTQTRAVLEAIGAGERTFSLIAREAGGGKPIASGTLAPVLATLIDKKVIAADQPLSTVPDTRNKRYRIADPYLRFWPPRRQMVRPVRPS